MAMTRRTARFCELATWTEEVLAAHEWQADPQVVDRLLNQRQEYVAELLGVEPRTALRSTPDGLAQSLAAQIIEEGLAVRSAPAPVRVLSGVEDPVLP